MSICIDVDPSNPGQFFACCGLLELADRLWRYAEGWFDEQSFSIECDGSLEELLKRLVMDSPEPLKVLDNGLTVKSIIAPLRFTFDGGASYPLILDVWVRTEVVKRKPAVISNTPWNFWSGQQTSFGIWSSLRLALTQQIQKLENRQYTKILTQHLPLTGRFGFDPSAAWNALDVGFSPNTQQMPVASSPATEMLAAIGLQRFRPVISDNRKSFLYSTWGRPLLPSVAASAASSVVLVQPAQCFRGYVVDRGQYAALGYSTLLHGGSNVRSTRTI